MKNAAWRAVLAGTHLPTAYPSFVKHLVDATGLPLCTRVKAASLADPQAPTDRLHPCPACVRKYATLKRAVEDATLQEALR